MCQTHKHWNCRYSPHPGEVYSQVDKLESDNDLNKSKKVELPNDKCYKGKVHAALRAYQPHPGNQEGFLK